MPEGDGISVNVMMRKKPHPNKLKWWNWKDRRPSRHVSLQNLLIRTRLESFYHLSDIGVQTGDAPGH